MNLWIRSQNRQRLIQVNDLVIRATYYNDNRKILYQIISFSHTDSDVILAFYETEKQALEVLDDINNYKDKLEKAHFLGMTESEFVSSTYEMPEE